MLTLEDITEQLGRGWFTAHLLHKITALQRQVAIHHADMNGMTWPSNLLGQMETALEQQDYTETTSLILQWKEWVEDSKEIQDAIWRTLILIESFIEFHTAENKDDTTN